MTRAGIGVLSVTIVSCLVGVITGYPEFLVFGTGFGITLLIAVGWMFTTGMDLAVSRSYQPERPHEGQRITVAVTMINRRARSCPPMMARDQIDGMPSAELAIPGLPGLARHTVEHSVVANRRGRLPVGRLVIGRSDPLRLLTTMQVIGPTDEILVDPRWFPGLTPLTASGAPDEDGPTSTSSPQGGVAFHSLRDYQRGDPWRLIHWRTTAKRGVPTVRHHVIPDEPNHVLLLDTDAEAYRPDGFEDAVRIAATLAVAIRRAGLALDLRTTRDGDAVALDRPAGSGGGNYRPALDLLRDVQQSSTGPDLRSCLIGMPAGARGVILGVIAGQLTGPAVRTLTNIRHRFQLVYVVQVGEAYPVAGVPGVRHTSVITSEEFVSTWRQPALPR